MSGVGLSADLVTALVPGHFLGRDEQHENGYRLELEQDPRQLVPAHRQRQRVVSCVLPSGVLGYANGLGVRDQGGDGCKCYTDTNTKGERKKKKRKKEKGERSKCIKLCARG